MPFHDFFGPYGLYQTLLLWLFEIHRLLSICMNAINVETSE